jgi:hypothetical protein
VIVKWLLGGVLQVIKPSLVQVLSAYGLGVGSKVWVLGECFGFVVAEVG